ncbi:HCL244Wp [Eremothecium sinecaudum]|uniref:HCL244Wp n=1 Tax=Eremothecium sinecaudum TaxID=45286 RepID=A0A109UYI7_9SACH|nr:HCL244Wp [Eremothecium sinecaudum]AMD19907.1 HCL244Wp [Eremothecium sinecaudum]
MEEVPPGRIQNITKDQELRLKQVWAHLFQYWGVPVDVSHVLTKDGAGDNPSVRSVSSGQKKKRLGVFHRKRTGSNSSDQNRGHRLSSVSVSTTRSQESIESKYLHSLLHNSLEDLDPKEVREKFWRMLRCDYPDNLLLRFVRARKWDIDKAMAMIAHTLRWRLKENRPDEIILGGEAAMYKEGRPGLIKQLELGKATVRGFDKNGHPIVYVRPKLHHSSDQTEQDVQEYSLLIIELARLFLREPQDSATIIFDMTGFSMSNMDYAPVKFLITCFEAHYPECLSKLFIHKAPWIFPPIWNIIKNWLDPVVASKIVFTKSLTDLEQYVPMQYIAKDLGGEDDYNYDGFVLPDPSVDEKLQDEEAKAAILQERDNIIEQFIQSTVNWIESATDEDSEKWLRRKIELSKELSANYSRLDPYIRSRSFYDVNGTLKVSSE